MLRNGCCQRDIPALDGYDYWVVRALGLHNQGKCGMESVYVETTVISYLVALPARDLVVAAHQQITLDWWGQRRPGFDCVISQVVIDEVSRGDPAEARKRLAMVDTLNVLAITTEVEDLTESIMKSGILPLRAVRDAAHVAVAAIHGIQYLLTWNCKHLANAQISRRIAGVCATSGFQMPIICTPEELLEEIDDAE